MRARYGRKGVYDAAVTRDGELIAEFRGRSHELRSHQPGHEDQNRQNQSSERSRLTLGRANSAGEAKQTRSSRSLNCVSWANVEADSQSAGSGFKSLAAHPYRPGVYKNQVIFSCPFCPHACFMFARAHGPSNPGLVKNGPSGDGCGGHSPRIRAATSGRRRPPARQMV